MRPGDDLPGVDAGQRSTGVIDSECIGGNTPGGGTAGLRRPLQPVGSGIAGRRRHRHQAGTVNISAGSHATSAAITCRVERLVSRLAGTRPQGQPQAGNHGGAVGDAGRAAAAHVADHPPPGAHRRVPAHGAPLLRGSARCPGRSPSASTTRSTSGRWRTSGGLCHPHPSRRACPWPTELGVGADNPFQYLTVPPPKPPPPRAEQSEAGDSSSWWGWPW